MSIWKDRSTYRYRVQRDGHVIAGSARTREEARILEAKAVQQLSAGVTGAQIKRTLDEAFIRYLESPEFLGLRSAGTVASKQIPHWMPYLRGRMLDQAREAADDAVRVWKARGLAVATINRRLSVLRRVLNLAHRRWDWITADIASKIPLLPGEAQRQVWLDRAQSVRLRRACPPNHIRAAVTLLLTTGMRVGELLAVQPAQVRDGAIMLDARTKTGRPRVVPILPPGVRYLRYLPIPIGYDGLRSAFDACRLRAGLPHVRLHDLRHTVGSLLAQSGASLRDVQVWLGHTNVATTTRYTHVDLARLEAVKGLVIARSARKMLGSKIPQQENQTVSAQTQDA